MSLVSDVCEIKRLVKQLNKANEAYYLSESPIMTDREFDEALNLLSELEKKTNYILSDSPTQKVGTSVYLSKLDKVKIEPVPMLSLEKVYNLGDIIAALHDSTCVIMSKLDGLSIRLIYDNGKLVSANTRGDGYIGTDVTEHVKHFKNVPLTISTKHPFIIDGEAVILNDDFLAINKNGTFKNSRNAASGALNLLDMLTVEQRCLSFIAWDVIESDMDDPEINTRSLDDLLIHARRLGFDIVAKKKIARGPYSFNTDSFNQFNDELIRESELLGYPIDGLVWKIDDKKYGESLGHTAHHFNNAVAWKPDREIAETALYNIEWTMGRTGVLTPIALFDPITLNGTTVERASLHNLAVMKELLHTPYVDQKIWVYKANLIIPQIDHADNNFNEQKEELKLPTKCPICGGEVKIHKSLDTAYLKCENPECSGKLINRLDHYCGKKGLDIKHLSKATLEKLIDWGWVNNILDLYNLRFYKNDWIKKDGFGVKSVERILDSIDESANCSLDKFLSSLGIPLVGKTVANKLAEVFKTYSAFRCAESFLDIEGIGPNIDYELRYFNYDEADYLYMNILNVQDYVVEKTTADSLKDQYIVITGKLSHFKNRDEFSKAIKDRKGTVQTSISNKTTYLVCNNQDKITEKIRNAKMLNVPIITEDEFISKFFD